MKQYVSTVFIIVFSIIFTIGLVVGAVATSDKNYREANITETTVTITKLEKSVTRVGKSVRQIYYIYTKFDNNITVKWKCYSSIESKYNVGDIVPITEYTNEDASFNKYELDTYDIQLADVLFYDIDNQTKISTSNDNVNNHEIESISNKSSGVDFK